VLVYSVLVCFGTYWTPTLKRDDKKEKNLLKIWAKILFFGKIPLRKHFSLGE